LTDPVNLQIPLCILLRLLRQHSLVVSEFQCLDQQSKHACHRALKACLLDGRLAEASSPTPASTHVSERVPATGD